MISFNANQNDDPQPEPKSRTQPFVPRHVRLARTSGLGSCGNAALAALGRGLQWAQALRLLAEAPRSAESPASCDCARSSKNGCPTSHCFFFGWEGKPPTKLDYRRKKKIGCPYSNLSTGGPSFTAKTKGFAPQLRRAVGCVFRV